jgi:hypothetical protein
MLHASSELPFQVVRAGAFHLAFLRIRASYFLYSSMAVPTFLLSSGEEQSNGKLESFEAGKAEAASSSLSWSTSRVLQDFYSGLQIFELSVKESFLLHSPISRAEGQRLSLYGVCADHCAPFGLQLNPVSIDQEGCNQSGPAFRFIFEGGPFFQLSCPCPDISESSIPEGFSEDNHDGQHWREGAPSAAGKEHWSEEGHFRC